MKESCCHVCGCAFSLRNNIGRIDRYLIFISNAKVNFDPSYAKRFLPSAKTNDHYVLLSVLSVSRTYSVFCPSRLSVRTVYLVLGVGRSLSDRLANSECFCWASVCCCRHLCDAFVTVMLIRECRLSPATTFYNCVYKQMIKKKKNTRKHIKCVYGK